MPIVGLLSLEFHIQGARSLKDKRQVLRSVKDRLRRLNVSIAEIDHQDLWQRCRLAIVTVGTTETNVEDSLAGVVEEIERHDPGLIISSDLKWLA